MIKTNFDRQALTEVYNILIMLDKENFEKIPINIIKAIKNNMDNEYEVEWEQIENGNMSEDTERILSVIYIDYLATAKEKEVIMQLENLKYRETYPIFKKKKTSVVKEKQLVVVKKENWFTKFFNKIKKFLGVK